MKIDMEQFLALTVALGCAGAVGYAVYADRAEMDAIVAGADAVEPAAAPEPTPVDGTEAPVVAQGPTPDEPTDLDEAAGIPPVVPDALGEDGPGPTSEMAQWQ